MAWYNFIEFNYIDWKKETVMDKQIIPVLLRSKIIGINLGNFPFGNLNFCQLILALKEDLTN